jgi:hypothetical protein
LLAKTRHPHASSTATSRETSTPSSALAKAIKKTGAWHLINFLKGTYFFLPIR